MAVVDTSVPPMTGHNRTGFAILNGCEPDCWVEWKSMRVSRGVGGGQFIPTKPWQR